MGAVSLSATTASAQQGALDALNIGFGSNLTSCSVCHTTAPALNTFGDAWRTAGGLKAGSGLVNFTTLGDADIDGDGINNRDEAVAGTLQDGLATATATTTTTDSGGGCVTSSVTTPLMMVLAMLSLGFFVRRKKS
ncbi:MAG: hypothetical protein Q9N67_02990 [Ghiorsea sp.]|nr:hypothetical protein [Ghiorsea sp.]